MRMHSTNRAQNPNNRASPKPWPLDPSCPLTDDDLVAVRKHRRAMQRGGYRPIGINSPWSLACPPHARGKAPLRKDWQKGQRSWQLLGTPTTDRDKAWAKAEANTGLLLGFREVPIQAIDIDVEDAAAVAGIVDLAAQHLPAGAIIRTRENTARCAVLFRCEPGAVKEKVQGERGAVERLAQGQQLVVHGTHPSGVPYVWRDRRSPWTVPAAELPLATESQIEAFLEAVDASGLLGSRIDRTAVRRRAPGDHVFTSDATEEMRDMLKAHGNQVLPAVEALIRKVGARGPGTRHNTLVTVTGELVRRRWSASLIEKHLVPLANEHFKECDWTDDIRRAVAYAEKQRAAAIAAAFDITHNGGGV